MSLLPAPPHCRYFEAGLCRSCTFIETPIRTQLDEKQRRCAELLPQVPSEAWLAPVAGGVAGFRNRAKLAVGGVTGAVTLGILDRGGSGVDLTDCLIHEPEIQRAIPLLAAFTNDLGIAPYSVPRRAGELKYIHVTVSPAEELMVRFVVRSEEGLDAIRRQLGLLRELLPQAAVISVNLLPEHKAVLEGEREEPLVGSALAMELGDGLEPVTLYLRPQSFFQTNTRVALALYEQAAAWVDGVDPASLWDLYCGVGGFALFTARSRPVGARSAGSGRVGSGAVGSRAEGYGVAGSGVAGSGPVGSDGGSARDVLGVELSEQAIRSAERSAEEAGVAARFLAGDATEFALAAAPADLPELVVVNPPRRGIGEALADWIERSPIPHVIYSSCNPESLARDLARMPSLRVREARLFDMFPHTGHLEVAVLLARA